MVLENFQVLYASSYCDLEYHPSHNECYCHSCYRPTFNAFQSKGCRGLDAQRCVNPGAEYTWLSVIRPSQCVFNLWLADPGPPHPISAPGDGRGRPQQSQAAFWQPRSSYQQCDLCDNIHPVPSGELTSVTCTSDQLLSWQNFSEPIIIFTTLRTTF